MFICDPQMTSWKSLNLGGKNIFEMVKTSCLLCARVADKTTFSMFLIKFLQLLRSELRHDSVQYTLEILNGEQLLTDVESRERQQHHQTGGTSFFVIKRSCCWGEKSPNVRSSEPNIGFFATRWRSPETFQHLTWQWQRWLGLIG